MYWSKMQKLIELLNEYTKQSYDDYSFFKYIEPTHSFYISDDGYESYIPEETILSKRFGFISWLVENDKIDRDKKEIEKSDYDITFTWALTMDKKSDLDIMVDTLLMLLSISDEPISDLISYLR